MKAAEYIVDFIAAQGVGDVFGYPGGMVTHLMDALQRPDCMVRSHVCLNEQGAALAACGYAQAGGPCGVAFATSGPGATNLLTGICNAYFDSIPFVAITGQVNTNESKGDYGVRQRGFQETDIVAMASPVTKLAKKVEDASLLADELKRAFAIACEGRPGPVLLDIPMDVQRGEVDGDLTADPAPIESPRYECCLNSDIELVCNILESACRPCILVGEGVRASHAVEQLIGFLDRTRIPVVSSMISVDLCPQYEHYHGFLGAYGQRSANFIVAKADVVLVLGARCDVRQVGGKRKDFARNAKLIRVDIDEGELSYKVHDDEMQLNMDVRDFLERCIDAIRIEGRSLSDWHGVCEEIEETLKGNDDRAPNRAIEQLSTCVPDEWTITVDVGQNQVWSAQSFCLKPNQRMLFSGGHGTMGYALPAAIGAYYATRKPVLCIVGDGGLQMNIQELEFLARESIPVNIVVANNHALGMIRHFQEMYFDGRYADTVDGRGYSAPDFEAIAKAYGIKARTVGNYDRITGSMLSSYEPTMTCLDIHEPTYVFPKLEFGKPNQDQEPLLDRETYQRLMGL